MHSPSKHPPKGYLSSKLASSARLGWKSKSSKKHERITANHIFELVSIYGISKTLHRKPAIFIEDSKYHSLVNGVRKVMPGLLNEFQIFDRPVRNTSASLNLSTISGLSRSKKWVDQSKMLRIW